MWVDPSARGLGPGPTAAGRAGAGGPGPRASTLLRLETNRSLVEAIALYRVHSATTEVDPFNDEVHAHHWFAKPLT